MNEEFRRWWNNKDLRSSLPATVLILAFFGLVLFYKYGKDNVAIRNDGYLLNIHTEVFGVALGAVVTIFVIDRLYERQRKLNLIDRLLYDARSTEPAVSKRAFEDMKYHSLIYGEKSILRGAYLRGAKPVNVDLSNAWLDGADLMFSNFSQSSFKDANLNSAKLCFANLNKADFRFAGLKKANLMSAFLIEANLCHADLEEANLESAAIVEDSTKIYVEYLLTPEEVLNGNRSTEELEQLILPDGNPATIETDMLLFTSPNHPNFWRSNDPKSPFHTSNYKELTNTLEKYGILEKRDQS